MDVRKVIGTFCAVGCQVIFGFSFLFIKFITGDVDVFAVLSWRFIIASIIMTILVMVKIFTVNFHYGKKTFLGVLSFAIFSPVLYFLGETFGVQATTASETGSFISCIPVGALIASALILKKKPSKFQIAGILITTSGVLLSVIAQGLSFSFSLYGYAMLLVAVVSCSLFSVFSERAGDFSSVEKTYCQALMGCFVFTLICVMKNLHQGTLSEFILLPVKNPGFLLSVFFLGAGCSVLAFVMYNKAIALLGTNRCSSYIGLATLVSILAGVLILHETFSVYQIVGTVLILCGVYLANVR